MKRLITFSDGTWNRPGTTDRNQETKTNVEILYNCIEAVDTNGIRQMKIYDQGVGTSTYDKKDQVLGGIAGYGIDKNIKDIYTFLVINYQPGDQLYFFGFSRGAYTARSLAGFVNNCGILKPENIHMVDYAYELYRDRNKYSHPDSDFMTSFRNQYCAEASTGIHFIGVWDTVGALGLPFPWSKKYNTERYKFHDVKLSRKVRYAFHALAIDEKRKQFSPTLWELSKTVKNDPKHEQVLQQRWFAGVHSNVGGGYADHGLSDLAMQWLTENAQKAGLCINMDLSSDLVKGYAFKPDYSGEIRNSLAWYYRLTFSARKRSVMTQRKNNFGEPMQTNESIDDSVYERYRNTVLKYKPRNLRNIIKQ